MPIVWVSAAPDWTRGTCSSSPAGCSCRAAGRAAGRRRRPRCSPVRWCRRPPGSGSSQRAQPVGDQSRARRPRRSAGSASSPGARCIGSVSRPAASSQWSSCGAQFGDRSARRRTPASDPLAGGLPGHRLGAVLAELGGLALSGSGSGQAQLGQSKPSTWLTFSSVCHRARGAHLGQRVLHRVGDARECRPRTASGGVLSTSLGSDPAAVPSERDRPGGPCFAMKTSLARGTTDERG